MPSLQIRNVPDDVYQALAFRAERAQRSLAQQALVELSDMRSTLDAAALGLGVAYVYRRFADSHLRGGDLAAVLEKYCGARDPFYLYFANRAQMPGKLRAFIDFVQAMNRDTQDEGAIC
jgi:DNA-binding transcriptional LysR family regulator